MRMDLDDMKQEALAKLPKPREKSITQKIQEQTNKKLSDALKKAKSNKLQEDSFSFSLTRCMDKQFADMVKPSIQNYQAHHSPINSSSSKSQFLLRNTFSYEAYQEFLTMRAQKKHFKQKRKELKLIINDTLERSITFEKNLMIHKQKTWKKMDYDARLQFIRRQVTEREQQRDEITDLRSRLKELKNPVLNVLAKFDKPNEEMKAIQGHLDVLMAQFVTLLKKMKKVTKLTPKLVQHGHRKEIAVLLKKKNMLELSLFRKKYERQLNYLSAVSTGDSKLNPFTAMYKPSVFNENLDDPKMKIRANAELYENVIKASMKSVKNQDAQKYKYMTEDQKLETQIDEIRQKMRQKLEVSRD